MDLSSIHKIIYMVFLGFGILGFLRGYFKGIFRSLADVIFVIISAGLSILVSDLIVSYATNVDSLIEMTEKASNMVGGLDEMVSVFKEYVTSSSASTINLVIALVSIIITPIVFIIVYLVMGLLLKLPKLLLEKFLCPKPKNVGLKLFGGFLGAIRYVLALAIFVAPVIGYAYYADDTIDMLPKSEEATVEAESEENNVIEMAEEYLSYVTDNRVFSTINTCGGKWLFNTLTTVKAENINVSLRGETEVVIGIYKASAPLLDIDLSQLGEKEEKAIDDIIVQVDRSEYFPALVSSILSFSANELLENGKLFVVVKPDLGADFNECFDTILEILATTDSKGFKKDIKLLGDILKTTIKYGVVQNYLNGEYYDVIHTVENGDYLGTLLLKIYEDERTRPMITAISNLMVNYIYSIYDAVNETYTPRPEPLDESSISPDIMYNEGKLLGAAVKELRQFLFTADLESGDMVGVILESDVASLGRSLDSIKKSVLLSRSFEFILSAVLHSEMCAELGIFDTDFVENASKHETSMEKMLVARQQIARLTMALYDNNDKQNTQDAVHTLIESIFTDDAESLKDLVSKENLANLGISDKKAATISGIITSVIDSVQTQEFESEKDKANEVEKTEKIITAVSSAVISSPDVIHVFSEEEGDESKSNMTANEFVETVLDSNVASEMIKASSNQGDDPYGIQDVLTSKDAIAMQEVLNERSTDDTLSESDKDTLKALADLFGVIYAG